METFSIAGVTSAGNPITVTGTIGGGAPAPPPGIDVRRAGARGDGITDDRAAIQIVLDSLTAGQMAYVPSGSYKLSGPLLVRHSGTGLIGDGDASQLLIGSSRGLWIGDAFTPINSCSVKRLSIIGQPGKYLAAGNIEHAILCDGALNTLIQHVTMNGVGQGVYSVNGANGTTHDTVTVNGWGGTAFGLWSGAVVKDCFAVQDDPGPGPGTSGHGIYLHAGSTNVTIDRTEIRNARDFGMQIYGETVGMIIGPTTIRDCIFRNCYGAFCISNYPAEAARAQNTVIQRCRFLGTYGGNAVTIQQGDGLDFSDNVIDGSPNFGLCIGVWPPGYLNGVLRNMNFQRTTIRNCAYGLGAGGTAANPGRFENCTVQGTVIQNCQRAEVRYDNTAGISFLS